MSTPTLAQLKEALSIAEQIAKLQAQLAAITGGISPAVPKAAAAPSAAAAKPGRRKLSPQALANIRAAQKARWAKIKGTAPAPAKAAPAKAPAAKAKKSGAMTDAHRAKLAAAAKKRWAAIKAGKAANPFASRAAKSAPAAKPATKGKAKRNISPEARAKMAAAAKRRWANVR